jgi:hypothetical protein
VQLEAIRRAEPDVFDRRDFLHSKAGNSVLCDAEI